MRYLILLFALAIIGCKDNVEAKDEVNGVLPDEVDEAPQGRGKKARKQFWEKLVMKEFRDANGTVLVMAPFPSGWAINGQSGNQGATITGPHGVSVTDFPGQFFMDNYNPALQQSYLQSGQRLRSMPGVDALIQQDIVPWLSGNGLQYVKHYEIPDISKMDKWYSDQLFKAMPSRSDVIAIGSEWQARDGKPYFLLIHLNVSTSDAMQTWYYRCTGLEAEQEYFETAKKQLIFGLSNARYNLAPIMAYNREEAQRVGQSWAAHNQRMAQNQRAFEASQRAHVNRTNAINEAIMSGWRERNAASDRNQERFIDAIREETNVVDPSTGQGYKVADGANQYWMNSNGEYIGTESPDYNPNLDENMNEERWRELKEVKR